ncbi:unnamed protein product [Psylliodes chrysocephalus]|uniref:Uncharacterized protein n=1 Tax=Psylliodes chrysocephalus TaxID=3402493 RepID=A0A9P0CYS3_9CUCU|nr:unnamed protein product [Psylliodes chrysocephala]
MSKENFNSSDCLARLHKIAEEIPSGVRRNEVESILPFMTSEELLPVTNSIIINAVKQKIDDFWNNYNISEKLKNLKEMQEKAPNEKAWRPTTGEVDVKPIIACALRERKKRLEEEIRRTKEKSDTLKSDLIYSREKLEKQILETNQ